MSPKTEKEVLSEDYFEKNPPKTEGLIQEYRRVEDDIESQESAFPQEGEKLVSEATDSVLNRADAEKMADATGLTEKLEKLDVEASDISEQAEKAIEDVVYEGAMESSHGKVFTAEQEATIEEKMEGQKKVAEMLQGHGGRESSATLASAHDDLKFGDELMSGHRKTYTEAQEMAIENKLRGGNMDEMSKEPFEPWKDPEMSPAENELFAQLDANNANSPKNPEKLIRVTPDKRKEKVIQEEIAEEMSEEEIERQSAVFGDAIHSTMAGENLVGKNNEVEQAAHSKNETAQAQREELAEELKFESQKKELESSEYLEKAKLDAKWRLERQIDRDVRSNLAIDGQMDEFFVMKEIRFEMERKAKETEKMAEEMARKQVADALEKLQKGKEKTDSLGKKEKPLANVHI